MIGIHYKNLLVLSENWCPLPNDSSRPKENLKFSKQWFGIFDNGGIYFEMVCTKNGHRIVGIEI